MKNFFRCPFHKTAQKEKSLLEVVLGNERSIRIKQMHEALSAFYNNPKIPALAFIIPDELLGTDYSFKELRTKLIPFQCERIAVELDIRLFPTLDYHEDNQENERLLESIAKNNRPLGLVAYHIRKMLLGINPTAFNSVESLASMLDDDIQHEILKGASNPGLSGKDKGWTKKNKKLLYRITLDGPTFYYENKDEFLKKDYRFNKNLFSFITCPLYPKEFGRYSKEVKLVLTRHADIESLPEDEQRRIRIESNTLLVNAGVRVDDFLEKSQGEGLWIPEYVAK